MTESRALRVLVAALAGVGAACVTRVLGEFLYSMTAAVNVMAEWGEAMSGVSYVSEHEWSTPYDSHPDARECVRCGAHDDDVMCR